MTEAFSTLDLALHAVRKMLDKGAEDVRLLQIDDENQHFDYVVLGNGRSERQAHTLINEVYHFCKRHKQSHGNIEGESGWYLIDCHNVIMHAFTEEHRNYYQLEELYKNSKEVPYEELLEQLHDPDLDLEEKTNN